MQWYGICVGRVLLLNQPFIIKNNNNKEKGFLFLTPKNTQGMETLFTLN